MISAFILNGTGKRLPPRELQPASMSAGNRGRARPDWYC
jgi:hypothetical protein